MEKTRKKSNRHSILPNLEMTRIDQRITDAPEKKGKSKASAMPPIEVKKKEKTQKVKIKQEKCIYCQQDLSESINGTRFSFACGHIFHYECYELSRISFKGSVCPICYGEERFSQIFSINEKSNTSEEMCDIDHSFGMIALDNYYDSRKTDVLASIQDLIPLETMALLDNPDLSLYRNFDPNDRVEIGKRANHAMTNLITTEKCQKIRKLFQRQTPVAEIHKTKFKRDDFLMAGIRMDFLIDHKYTLKDIYNLGFRTFKDLLTLNFQNHMLSIFNDHNEAFVPIGFLVDYYYVDYKIMINTFADYYSNQVKRDENIYQMAVADFCRLKLSKKELIKLKLTNINLFFQQFGKNCLNADCIVNFCDGYGVNQISTLQDTFKFYGQTMENIKGFTHQHFVQLGWPDDHPLKAAVMKEKHREQARQKNYSDSNIPSVKIADSDDPDPGSEESNEISGSEETESDEFSEDESDGDGGVSSRLREMQRSGLDFSDLRMANRGGSGFSFPEKVPVASSSNLTSLSSVEQSKSTVILPTPPLTPIQGPSRIVRRGLLGV